MVTNNNSDDILRGWPEITEYAKMSRFTIQRLSQRETGAFPIAKTGRVWFTTRSMVSSWHLDEVNRQRKAKKRKKRRK